MISRGVAAALAVLVVAAPALAQERDFSKVEIKTHKLTDSIVMLEGLGGNIGLCYGDDGALLIDDQFAPLSDKIKEAIAALTPKPVRFLVNTHWHPDHTGGNANFGRDGAVIVAHDNVRARLSVDQVNELMKRTTPASPAAAWPIITFDDEIELHVNGEDLKVFHVANAHTDGDAIVWFRKANVIHMGDCLFNGRYPVIDLSTGGSIDGMIAADDKVLAMIDDQTQVIPGHGPMATKADLRAFRDMLAGIRDKVKGGIAKKKTRDQVLASKPAAAYDEKWGKGSFTSDQFVGIVYTDLSRPQAKPAKAARR